MYYQVELQTLRFYQVEVQTLRFLHVLGYRTCGEGLQL